MFEQRIGMTTPFWCVFAVFAMLWVPRTIVALKMKARPEGYDNRTPRAQQAQLSGLGLRAKAAHENTFEALTMFAPAVFIAHLGHGDLAWSSRLAIAFVIARAAYIACYLGDVATLRSAVWTVGILATAGLYVLPALG
jgi:hypothetical protein